MGRADSSQSGRGMHSSLLEEAIWLKRTRLAISSSRNRGLGGGDLIWIWNEAPSVGERGGELNCGAAGCSLSPSLLLELVPPASLSLSPRSALSIHKALLI